MTDGSPNLVKETVSRALNIHEALRYEDCVAL
jgi:hypothetical protein